MRKRARGLLSLALAVVPVVSLSQACGGTVIEPGGSATCESVCSAFGSCEPTVPTAECVAGCEMEQEECAANGASSTFQALLSCLAGLTCSGGSVVIPEETMCGSELMGAQEECLRGGLPPEEGGVHDDLPLIDVGFDSPEPDAPGFETGPDSSGDSPVSDGGVDSSSPDGHLEGGMDSAG
jgi:hypothetical protein